MAVFADVGRLNVPRRLADRIVVVVTTGAVCRETVMIEVRRQPAVARVAVVTAITARDVILGSTESDGVVVAARTAALDLQVIDLSFRREGRDRVAVFADISCRNMVLWLADRFNVVVAAGAVRCEVGMIEVCRQPAIRCVAVFTASSALNMILRFAIGNRVVVAARATAADLAMIDTRCRRERHDRVAVLAGIRRLNVPRRLADRLDVVIVTTGTV